MLLFFKLKATLFRLWFFFIFLSSKLKALTKSFASSLKFKLLSEDSFWIILFPGISIETFPILDSLIEVSCNSGVKVIFATLTICKY